VHLISLVKTDDYTCTRICISSNNVEREVEVGRGGAMNPFPDAHREEKRKKEGKRKKKNRKRERERFPLPPFPMTSSIQYGRDEASDRGRTPESERSVKSFRFFAGAYNADAKLASVISIYRAIPRTLPHQLHNPTLHDALSTCICTAQHGACAHACLRI